MPIFRGTTRPGERARHFVVIFAAALLGLDVAADGFRDGLLGAPGLALVD